MRGKVPDDFYRSRRWAGIRRSALVRDRFVCQECARFGKRIAADTVHHILPRIEFPEYQWTMWNLVSLCRDCHDAMHDRNTNALSIRGVELLKRIARKRGVELPLRYRD